MKRLIFIVPFVIVMMFEGCGTGNQLAQKNATANSYYEAGNYKSALVSYNEIIHQYESNNNSTACPIYTNAGESALKTGDNKLAVSYLSKAKHTNYVNENTYFLLGEAYKLIDNLSLEISTLEDYLKLYPNGKHINTVKMRLFYTYVESQNFDKALNLWPDINDDKNDVKLLEAYYIVNKELDNNDSCNNIAEKLLSIDKDNLVALYWFGKQYYRKAEDRYQVEIKAYEKEKTNKQYNILIKALEVVTVDFKKSLNYFKKIYTLQPTSQNAKYLSHIYGRLGDKKKADYYMKLAE